MKRLRLSALIILAGLTPVQAEPEITASDVAQHLGIHFWKFPQADLPAKYSVAIVEIKDGKIVDTLLGSITFPDSGDLVIGANLDYNGDMNVTISVGGAQASLGTRPRKKIGFSAKLPFKKVKLNEPMVLAADYRLVGNTRTTTGKVEDVESGIALKLFVDK